VILLGFLFRIGLTSWEIMILLMYKSLVMLCDLCGGFAIELFLNQTICKHGDIDLSAYCHDRDKIIASGSY
jgi:hypothetical protein